MNIQEFSSVIDTMYEKFIVDLRQDSEAVYDMINYARDEMSFYSDDEPLIERYLQEEIEAIVYSEIKTVNDSIIKSIGFETVESALTLETLASVKVMLTEALQTIKHDIGWYY